MATHTLKTWPGIYKDVITGDLKFTVRRADRNFKVGDTIHLNEFLPSNGTYTGRWTECEITHILEGDKFGIDKSHVGLSYNLIK